MASAETKDSAWRLGLVAAAMQRRRERTPSMQHDRDLVEKLSDLNTQLIKGTWTTEDFNAAKTVVRQVGETLLEHPSQTIANWVSHILRLTDGWQDWAADPCYQHALANVLLQTRDIRPAGRLNVAASGISLQWCQEICPTTPLLHVDLIIADAVPSYTPEQVAGALFGPGWLALYGDVLEDPDQMACHFREARPPFMVHTADSFNAVTTPASAPPALPTNLSVD